MNRRQQKESESAFRFIDKILRDPKVRARASAEYLKGLEAFLEYLTEELRKS